jgi:hypothetical protein
MQDGWSGIQQSPIISHCVSVEAKRTLFIDAVATKTDVKDAAYCCMLLNDAIRSAENDFECRVGAIITDNCNTMISMKNLISSQKPGIWTYGCQVHLLNLIGKEVTSTEILVKVKEVQHFFKDKTFPRETLKLIGGLQPVLPCEPRWNTSFACLANFVKNHTKYMDIVKDPDSKATEEIVNIIGDLSFFKKVEAAMNKVQPVVDAIRKVCI